MGLQAQETVLVEDEHGRLLREPLPTWKVYKWWSDIKAGGTPSLYVDQDDLVFVFIPAPETKLHLKDSPMSPAGRMTLDEFGKMIDNRPLLKQACIELYEGWDVVYNLCTLGD